ncbi:hypothetical protein KIN20_033649 [Parelaphostrongylus tenuis]|uniref:dolichyl-phosphate-mannose--protein mannosyltransferase n=1 Tax=Parelaphostrongylus tenuis TaxID=148309 RepID=A0AAD5WIL8_PARTN|nr:hypothetical protein KIN20_033649 [Parelaphostrongylus tenuis]
MAIVPYFPSIDGEFVFDDSVTVVNNPVVNGKAGIEQMFDADYWGQPIRSPQSHKSYRPLTTLTFWLNYRLHGLWTPPYHIVNIILHVLSSALVFFLAKSMQALSSEPLVSHFVWDEALVAAAMFAVHPVHTEAVANISGRAELMMSAFALSSLLYYDFCLRNSVFNLFNTVVICILVMASVGSKEQGVTILPVFLLLEIFNYSPKKRGMVVLRCTLVATFTVTIVLLRLSINGFSMPKFTELDNAAAFVGDRWLRLASYCYQWLVNVRLLVFPHSLCFDYSMGCVPAVESWTDYRALSLPFVFAMVVCTVIFLYKSNDRLLYLSVVLGVVTFLPASNLLVTRLFKNTDKFLAALLIIAASKTYQRSEEWRTELDLYTSGLRVCMKNAKVHYNLGKVLSKIGDVDGAEHNYWNAIRLNPNYEHALNNLANILEAKGRRKEAELLLRKAVQNKPTFATAWMNLGITLMNQNKYQEALQSFHQSLRLRPFSADCLFNIGNLYQKMGQPQEALEAWMNATRLDPSHTPALTNLFVLLDELERCTLVVEMSTKLPNTIINHQATLAFQIGVCLAKMTRYHEAEERLKTAVRLNPHKSMYYANLGVLYQRWARYELAEAMYLQALSIDLHTNSVIWNLRAVQEKLNRSRTFTKHSLS